MNKETIIAQVVNALVPLAIAVGTWALYAAANWFRAHAKSEYQRGVIYRLTDAVETIVRETQQTTAAELRQAAKDGKITKEEAEELKTGAVRRIRGYLGENGVAELERIFDKGMLDKVIAAKVEAAVSEMKEKAPSLPPPA